MNSYRNIGIALLAGALLLAGFAGNALAWQAAACSTISNQATLEYSVGGVPQPDIDSDGDTGLGGVQTTDFRVDSLVDLAVDTIATPVNATGVNQVLRFRITNLGNDTQQYGLQLYEGVDLTDDQFNMANVRVYVDTNNNELLDGGDSLVANDVGGSGPAFSTTFNTLTGDVLGAVGANDNTLAVFVVSNVPAGRLSAETAGYSLKAITFQSVAAGGNETITGGTYGSGTETVENNSCGNPVVIGDDDDDATKTAYNGVSDEARNAAAYDSGLYTVVAAGVSVAKAVSAPLWDPINLAVSPQAIPGAYVQYTITIANAIGGAAATLTQITDALATTLALDPDLTTAGPGTPESAVNDAFKVVVTAAGRAQNGLDQFFTYNTADGVDFTTPTITATFATIMPVEGTYAAGELKAGESVTLTFNAIIQ